MAHEFLDLIELVEVDDEADGKSVIARTFELVGDRERLKLDLEIVAWHTGARYARILECVKPFAWRFTDEPCDRALVSDDHPAVVEFRDRRADLTFRGRVEDPSALANALRTVHHEYVGEYIDFGTVANEPLTELFAGDFGQIAAGPTSLLEKMGRVADSAGLSTTIQDCGPPVRYLENAEGGSWVEISTPPWAIDFGGGFVVAERFVVSTG
ncbi:MAG: hypothetical protein ACPHCI_08650 [Solirubrobacterales bacterium]